MYEHIKALFAHKVPFAAHTSVTVTEVGPGTAQAVLPERDELKNHIGSQHAAALFCLGETASGAAMGGALGAHLATSRPVAADAQIKYEKVARGPITAFATCDIEASEIIETLTNEGKIVFNVEVVMKDADDLQVCSMRVAWHVRHTG